MPHPGHKVTPTSAAHSAGCCRFHLSTLTVAQIYIVFGTHKPRVHSERCATYSRCSYISNQKSTMNILDLGPISISSRE